MKKIYIRADMNNVIATGHMVRCMSIAGALAHYGAEAIFIGADSQAADMVSSYGYRHICLNTKWDDMESETDSLIKLIKKEKISTLLIDSYMVTKYYFDVLKDYADLLYIEDTADEVYSVDGIICYAGYYRKLGLSSKYDKSKLIVGPQYTPLRREFWDNEKKTVNKNVKNILIMSGGTDPYGLLLELTKNLDLSKYDCVKVICGRYYKDMQALKSFGAMHDNIIIINHTDQIKKHMTEADVVISAGGTTLYELCACGTPSISYSMADNQLLNVEQFCEDKLIPYAGDLRQDAVVSNVLALLESQSMQYESRKEVSSKMQELIDGRGAKRIARKIIG